jgi:hypothetical protein
VSAVALTESAGGLVPLSEVLAGRPPGMQPAAGFLAWVHGPLVGSSECEGGPFPVTAVLERTAVLQLGPDDRRLARHDALLVEAGALQWQEAEPRPSIVHRPRRRLTRSDGNAGGRQAPADRPSQGVPSPPLPADPPSRAGDETTAPSRQDPSVTEVVAGKPPAAVQPRSCRRCEGLIPPHNRRGLCVRCQRICPTCGGPKSIQAAECHGCGRQAANPDPGVSRAEAALRDLPVRVQELLDQVLTLARYAVALEDELDRYRSLARELLGQVDQSTGRRRA